MAYKLVVMGSCGVGKSALTNRFFQKQLVTDYTSSALDLYQIVVVVDGDPCQLIIWDSLGGEQQYDQWEAFMRWGDGFLCVYAVDYIKTFVDLNLFWDKLQEIKGTSRVPMVLVANKTDQAHWLVDSDLGQEAAKNFGVPFVETSAKTGQNVEHAFHQLVRQIRRVRAEVLPDAEQNRGCGFKYCTIM
ncbi:GTPase NRas-like [Antechinus flavipes]|uniref:GTPase NRas-like n=1 Tax=Antechinus flavipes TaxID=38775 RepID=UPI002235E7B2|nr:GTPase NRas-like [Antechinus flavipes]